MYQGKFLPENRETRVVQLRHKRNHTPAAEKEPVQQETVPQETVAMPPVVQPAPVEQASVPTSKENKHEAAAKKRRGPRVSTIIFYTFYLLLIVASVFGIRYGLGMLEDWLVVYESSQPDTKSQEIFDQLFGDPDWGEIYDLAGLEDTEYEGKESYVTYMEQLVGDQELTFTKTSAGLSGGEKYIVRVGEIKVATFTMENPVTDAAAIPQWSLSEVEAGFFTRDWDVTILTRPDRTVLVNGVALDESHVIKTTVSTVDEYLPEGVHGPRTATLYAKGFLVAPQVTVLDETGETVELTYDPVTSTYTETQLLETVPEEISDGEYQAILNATMAYSKAMIGADTRSWKQLFVRNSAIYKQIQDLVGNNSFFRGWTHYKFEEETITEYHRYTDDLFSARIKMTLNTYRADGSVKPFELDTTIFMTRDGEKWLVSQLVNAQVHGTVTQVRMTWTDANGQVLDSWMVDASSNFLNPPAVAIPEGMVFVGWFQEIVDDQGNRTLKLIFAPTENGSISLPDDYVLEPMVLIARFERQGA